MNTRKWLLTAFTGLALSVNMLWAAGDEESGNNNEMGDYVSDSAKNRDKTHDNSFGKKVSAKARKIRMARARHQRRHRNHRPEHQRPERPEMERPEMERPERERPEITRGR